MKELSKINILPTTQSEKKRVELVSEYPIWLADQMAVNDCYLIRNEPKEEAMVKLLLIIPYIAFIYGVRKNIAPAIMEEIAIVTYRKFKDLSIGTPIGEGENRRWKNSDIVEAFRMYNAGELGDDKDAEFWGGEMTAAVWIRILAQYSKKKKKILFEYRKKELTNGIKVSPEETAELNEKAKLEFFEMLQKYDSGSIPESYYLIAQKLELLNLNKAQYNYYYSKAAAHIEQRNKNILSKVNADVRIVFERKMSETRSEEIKATARQFVLIDLKENNIWNE